MIAIYKYVKRTDCRQLTLNQIGSSQKQTRVLLKRQLSIMDPLYDIYTPNKHHKGATEDDEMITDDADTTSSFPALI